MEADAPAPAEASRSALRRSRRKRRQRVAQLSQEDADEQRTRQCTERCARSERAQRRGASTTAAPSRAPFTLTPSAYFADSHGCGEHAPLTWGVHGCSCADLELWHAGLFFVHPRPLTWCNCFCAIGLRAVGGVPDDVPAGSSWPDKRSASKRKAAGRGLEQGQHHSDVRQSSGGLPANPQPHQPWCWLAPRSSCAVQ